jgi:polyphenol oxidase
LIISDALAGDGIRHAFFTRDGGVSEGIFASLNCGLGSGDDKDKVLENRRRAAAALDRATDELVTCYQVHSPQVAIVDRPWRREDRPRADAMVTRMPGIALGILTADCVPVLFADAEARIIGAAHAGWRGAVAGVIEATIAAMARLGARPAAIIPAIGPCIRQQSYEVGADLRDAVLAHDASSDRFFAAGRREARWQFDLAGYCAARLAAAGIARTSVLDADTAADEDTFFSYRRRTLGGGGPIGHQISIVALDPR